MLLEEFPHVWRLPAKVLPFEKLVIPNSGPLHAHGAICHPAGNNALANFTLLRTSSTEAMVSVAKQERHN